MSHSLDLKLQECLQKRPRNLLRLVSLTKKDMDARLTEKLQEKGYPDFKLGDLALIVNIPPEGTINNDLAKKARISKQAMSKVVKNLETAGYILTRKHETDNRAVVIFLSEKGKQLLITVSESVDEIQEMYVSIIGDKEQEALISTLFKLINTLHPEI
jgi:DNA-binding MarR family transcriptional regulator